MCPLIPEFLFSLQSIYYAVVVFAEDMGEGLIAMQLMLDSVVLEVHVTDKIPLLSGAEKKNDDISTLFPSLPSASLTAEPKVNGDRPEVSAPPGKSSKGRISSVTPGQSGGIKMAYAGTYDKGKKAMSSSDESGEVQIASNVETSDEAKKELSSPGEDVEKQKVSSSPGEGSKEKELLSCPSGNIDETKGVLSEQPGENVKMKSIPRDLGVVKEASEHGQPFLPEEELTMDLPPLAPYVPVVELYTQLGAQVTNSTDAIESSIIIISLPILKSVPDPHKNLFNYVLSVLIISSSVLQLL